MPGLGFAAKAEPGEVVRRPGRLAGVRFGGARRDSSMTLVLLCLNSASVLRGLSPIVDDGGRTLRDSGLRVSYGRPTIAAFIYPPSVDRRVAVSFGDSHVAVLRFPASRGQPCPYRDRRDFQWISCGTFLLAEWDTNLRIPASKVALTDVRTFDSAGRPLGFYLDRLINRNGKLAIEFAFRPPSTKSVTLQLAGIYLRKSRAVRHPDLRATIRLTPAK